MLSNFWEPVFFYSFAYEFADKKCFLNDGSDESYKGTRDTNSLDFMILEKWAFENFILADEPFAKTLRTFETYVSVNKNLYGKLVSPLEFPIKFDERFTVTLVPFFIANFNLLSCKLGHFTFNVLYLVILYYINILLKQNKIIIL